jgi:hypothetical protein
MDKTSLTIKRTLVWGISFVIGFVLTFLLVYLYLDTDIETYSVKYFLLTAIPLSFLFLVWGDVLLGTNILPD